MNTQDRFAQLWTDYLEGELDQTGLAELRERLAADPRLIEHATDLLQTHRLLGLVMTEAPARQDAFVRQTMAQLPHGRDAFVSQVMSKVQRAPTAAPPTGNRPAGHHRWLADPNRLWIALAILFAGVLLFSFWPQPPAPIASDAPPTPAGAQNTAKKTAKSEARLASVAQAKFFGELSPPVGSVLAVDREYVLMEGLVEVTFPAGASAIIESPAVFRVTSNESLAVDVGRCSVHAPDGAEGFRVETPVTRVVDRGTRFTVDVGETSDTEVHVLEGAADVYDLAEEPHVSEAASGPTNNWSYLRLTVGQARKFVDTGTLATDIVAFDASAYRHALPDRVISYRATQAADGSAENLQSVTVQRGGEVAEFPVDQLIAARVTYFHATEPRAFLCGGVTPPALREGWLSDHSLVTGVINPDGSPEPLATDPVLEGDVPTPGLAIHFERPVINGPGPDIVFFELQTFANPPQGDAFHVSPLVFHDGLKSHTIDRYDLTMESPETLDLASFHVHFFATAAGSLRQLNAAEPSSQRQSIKFRGLAVGIDLSALGYPEGKLVEGLFIQDAIDDTHHVDPVFIAGLPEMK